MVDAFRIGRAGREQSHGFAYRLDCMFDDSFSRRDRRRSPFVGRNDVLDVWHVRLNGPDGALARSGMKMNRPDSVSNAYVDAAAQFIANPQQPTLFATTPVYNPTGPNKTMATHPIATTFTALFARRLGLDGEKWMEAGPCCRETRNILQEFSANKPSR